MKMSVANSDDRSNCPHCNASLIGDIIPEHLRGSFSGTHWKREIGIEHRDLYDGVWEWQCPDCNGKWPSASAVVIMLEKRAEEKFEYEKDMRVTHKDQQEEMQKALDAINESKNY